MKLLIAIVFFSYNIQAFTTEHREDFQEFLGFAPTNINMFALANNNPSIFHLPENKAPWSGSFWPDRAGSIAVNYTNGDLIEKLRILFGPKLEHIRFESRLQNIEDLLKEMSEEELNELSPAEKYDLLMGDTNFTFSNKIWERVEQIRNYSNGLAFWSGICHGWAPASIHMPRPRHAVEVPILDGSKKIKFYPEDLKALGSYLWATKANTDNIKFSGNRCNIKRPKVDVRTGLVMPLDNPTRSADECADTDPAVFHVVTVKRLATHNKSFIVDVDYNATVNNHPVVGYEIKYFNPTTGDYENFQKSMVTKYDIVKDPLKEIRKPETLYVVGVEMNLQVADWKIPERQTDDSRENDGILVKTYIYQLDLDINGNIVGGHWRTTKKDSRPNAVEDRPRIPHLGLHSPSYPDFIWDHSDYFKPKEFFSTMTDRLSLDFSSSLQPLWTLASIKNAENTIVLLNSNRIRHHKARRAGLNTEAQRIANSEGISFEQAAIRFESEMNRLGVPRKDNNPQIISRVIYGLFELAQ